MSEAITLRFRYLKDEYIRAVRFHFRKTMKVNLDLVVAAVFGLMSTYFFWVEGISWISVGGLLLSLLLLLIVFFALVVVPSQVYRESDKLKEDYVISFTDEGIHFRTASIDSHLQWDLYDKWSEGIEFFMLYYGKRSFTVIPKRAFENGDDEQRFRNLLSTKVRQG